MPSTYSHSSLAPCGPVALAIQAFRDGYTYYLAFAYFS